MLEVHGVHAFYGTSHVLQGISLTVPRGRCVVLLGRNGAGKTTTIHTVAGIVKPRQGTITFKGQAIQGLPPWRVAQRGIGLVPQGRRIFPSLTVRENLTMAYRSRRKSDGPTFDLDAVFSLFPVLKERQHHWGNQLSGGEQQMLAIGRTLLTNPELLLMDEPSEGLAPIVIEFIGQTILELKAKGLSMLMVEQNIDLACAVADEILIMNKGRIVWTGDVQQFFREEEVKYRYLGIR